MNKEFDYETATITVAESDSLRARFKSLEKRSAKIVMELTQANNAIQGLTSRIAEMETKLQSLNDWLKSMNELQLRLHAVEAKLEEK